MHEYDASKKINIDSDANFILGELSKAGYEGFIVGGCVRDALLNTTPHDWDICTNALPEQVINLFRNELKLNVIETGLKHGTVTVMVNKEPFEVTTYRIDGQYSDGRRPNDVEFVSDINKDLSRRDFTINAMAYNQHGIVGVEHCIDDLKSGIIRCVGNPEERFTEDALRIVRAVRFASKLGFDIEPNTLDAMNKLKGNLINVSAERKRDELCKTLLGKNRCTVLREYKSIIFEIIPELRELDGCKQNNPNHLYDVYEHTIKAMEDLGDSETDLNVLLAVLLHDISKPETARVSEYDGYTHFYGHAINGSALASKIMHRLRFDNITISNVCGLIKYHDMEFVTKSSVKHFLNTYSIENMQRLSRVRHADIMGQSEYNRNKKLEGLVNANKWLTEIVEENAAFKISDLEINGRDLIELGYKPGKIIGVTLNDMLNSVIDGTISNTHSELVEYAKKHKDVTS